MTTSRLAQARAAVRPALKARLMISGPTGAGKTWTALKIAEVLAEGGKILVIDTEKESALTYADTFTFVHLPWLPPFEPRELARTMAEAGHEYAVVIVDSTSHFWRKEGGTLDIAGGKFTGWKDARPAQEDLVQALLDCHAHVILCARSKMEHVQEEINGRHVVRKVGMAPQQDDDLEYELNISIEMDMDHRATVAKSRADAVQVGRSFTAGHEVELAALYADWLKGGEPPAAQPVVDDLVARMNALPPAERVACKTEFVEAFGRPDGLRESRVPEAEGLVARFEGRGGGGGDEPEGSAAAPPPPGSQDPGGTSAEVPSGREPQAQQPAPPAPAADVTGGGEQRPRTESAPAETPPSGDPVPWKTTDEDAWAKWNRRTQAKARGTKDKPGVLDPDDTIRDAQRHDLALQASRHRQTPVGSWSDVTETEATAIEDGLDLLKNNKARMVQDQAGRWSCDRTQIEAGGTPTPRDPHGAADPPASVSPPPEIVDAVIVDDGAPGGETEHDAAVPADGSEAAAPSGSPDDTLDLLRQAVAQAPRMTEARAVKRARDIAQGMGLQKLPTDFESLPRFPDVVVALATELAEAAA